ncbi:MAG TPA: GNAT family N-acetyltransferase [Symbiobacteriaceae bacterium]|jgi:ribosomal protein S18 acetylase RimI-like enzyme|nr:GNAT family N-acetyltransferase [Symbiobacteriaceae bacterium]
MPIRIRRASPADEAAIDQWQRTMENLDEYLHLPQAAARDPETVRKRFAEWLRLPREQKVPGGWERIDLVAVEDFGAICGYAAVMFGPKDQLTGEAQGYVGELHVWPEYRSRGVAKGLLDMAEAYALQRGVPYLSITVAAAHTGTVKLFQDAGYRPETVKLTKKVTRPEST